MTEQWTHKPDNEHRLFLYDSDLGFRYFRTEEERQVEIKKLIKESECHPDYETDSFYLGVIQITHRSEHANFDKDGHELDESWCRVCDGSPSEAVLARAVLRYA